MPLEPIDERLTHAIRAGDERAFVELVEQYATSLARFAYAFLKSRDDAEDVVQEVFWNVWQRHGAWNPTRGIRIYLLAATRNRCVNRLEHLQVHHRYLQSTEALIADAPETAIDAVEHAEHRRLVQRAIDTLSVPQREAVMLRYQQQLSYKEGAAVMGISSKAFEMHLARARAQLAPLVEAFRKP